METSNSKQHPQESAIQSVSKKDSTTKIKKIIRIKTGVTAGPSENSSGDNGGGRGPRVIQMGNNGDILP